MAGPAGSCCPAEGTTAKSAATLGPAPKPAACSWTRAAPAATPSAACPAPSRSGADAQGTVFCLCVHCSAVMPICLKSQAMSTGSIKLQSSGRPKWSLVQSPARNLLRQQSCVGRCERRCTATRSCGRHPCKRRCCDGNCPPCDQVQISITSTSYDNHSITTLRSSSLPSAPFATCCQAKHFHC